MPLPLSDTYLLCLLIRCSVRASVREILEEASVSENGRFFGTQRTIGSRLHRAVCGNLCTLLLILLWICNCSETNQVCFYRIYWRRRRINLTAKRSTHSSNEIASLQWNIQSNSIFTNAGAGDGANKMRVGQKHLPLKGRVLRCLYGKMDHLNLLWLFHKICESGHHTACLKRVQWGVSMISQ